MCETRCHQSTGLFCPPDTWNSRLCPRWRMESVVAKVEEVVLVLVLSCLFRLLGPMPASVDPPAWRVPGASSSKQTTPRRQHPAATSVTSLHRQNNKNLGNVSLSLSNGDAHQELLRSGSPKGIPPPLPSLTRPILTLIAAETWSMESTTT